MCAKRKRRRKSIILRLLVLGVAGYMIFTVVGLYTTLAEDKRRLAESEKQRDSLQVQVDEIRALLDDGSQSELIERAARERLGYVFADEEIYIDISGS